MHRYFVKILRALEIRADERVGRVGEIDLTREPELYGGAVDLVRISRLRAMEIQADERVGRVGEIDLTREPELYGGAVDVVRISRLRAINGEKGCPTPRVKVKLMLYAGAIAAGIALVVGVLTLGQRSQGVARNVAERRESVKPLKGPARVAEPGTDSAVARAFRDSMIASHKRFIALMFTQVPNANDMLGDLVQESFSTSEGDVMGVFAAYPLTLVDPASSLTFAYSLNRDVDWSEAAIPPVSAERFQRYPSVETLFRSRLACLSNPGTFCEPDEVVGTFTLDAATTPEPSTICFVGLGLTILTLAGWRLRRATKSG